MATAYELKIILERVKPAVWRRVVVPHNLNLARLHMVIQDAMGWENCHLHQFVIGEASYGPDPRDDGFGPSVLDEKQFIVGRLQPKDRVTYEYDFGDGWTHEIRVERVVDDTTDGTPRCVDGARACPPEDCGGAWGYADLVKALANPRHERHEEMKEWVGDEWSPDAFDVAAADRRVARHRPQPGRARQGKPAHKRRISQPRA